MKTYREEITQCTKRVAVLVCDNCNKQFDEPTYDWHPDEKVLMPMFVGFSEPYKRCYEQCEIRKYGIDLGEWCKDCREQWFESILKMFPRAIRVKINN